MNTIQYLFLIFFVIAVVKTVRQFRVRDISFGMLIGWIIFWIMAAYVVISPDATFYLARVLGVARGADAVMYIAVALLFFMVFRLLVGVERLKKQVTLLTRESALKNVQIK